MLAHVVDFVPRYVAIDLVRIAHAAGAEVRDLDADLGGAHRGKPV